MRHMCRKTWKGLTCYVTCPAPHLFCPLQVYGRNLLLCDCDNFTHEWYQKQLGVHMRPLRVMIGCLAVCGTAPTSNTACLQAGIGVPRCLTPRQHATCLVCWQHEHASKPGPVSGWLQVAGVECPEQKHLDASGELPAAAQPSADCLPQAVVRHALAPLVGLNLTLCWPQSVAAWLSTAHRGTFLPWRLQHRFHRCAACRQCWPGGRPGGTL